MNSKIIIISTIVLVIALVAEGIFYFLARTGKIDVFGYNAREDYQIRDTIWGVAGVENGQIVENLAGQWGKLDLYWQDVEESGWQDFQDKLKAMDQLKLVVTLHANSRGETVCSKKLSKVSSCPPLDIEKYQEFVAEAFKQSKGKVKFWQIEDRALNFGDFWQGNKEQYARLLKAASKIIKEQDRDNEVILSGIALGNLDVNDLTNSQMRTLEENLTYIFSQAKDSFDVVDVHLFSTLDSVPKRIKWLQNKMKVYNFLKPVWSLEMSGPDLSVTEYSSDLQAQEVVKRFLIGFESGLEKILYFHWQDQEIGQIDPLAATLGLLDAGGDKKPAYIAYKTMVQNLAGFNHLRKLNLKSGVIGYQLSFPAKQSVFVFWADKEVKITLPAEIESSATAKDYLGNSVAIADGKINLDSKPVYIITTAD